MVRKIDGRTLIAWGLEPSLHFGRAIEAARAAVAAGADQAAARAAAVAELTSELRPLQPPHAAAHGEFITPETEAEHANLVAVRESIAKLSETPTVTATAVMPDACPSGAAGTIPVGGVAATKGAIHPGMHSTDICCSVAITVVGDADPAATLDGGHRVTHFGGGGRGEGNPLRPSADVIARFEANRFLADLVPAALDHFGTQGDGNHFLFVGRLRSTGETCLVTHHGSRKPGAMLYKRGMVAAEANRRRVSPETLKQNAWIEADSREGEDYWEALQTIRAWTKENHFAIHEAALQAAGARARGRFWNEHNFVFRRGDVFLHGKGATPAWRGYAEDETGQVLIPLNMAAPVLIAEGADRADALGFCPHGAGRNVSRSAHMRALGDRTAEDVVAEETKGLDVRFFHDIPDASELPSAYKRADAIEAQIEDFGLARIVDRVDPWGCIMAGDWQAPWRAARAAKKAARA